MLFGLVSIPKNGIFISNSLLSSITSFLTFSDCELYAFMPHTCFLGLSLILKLAIVWVFSVWGTLIHCVEYFLQLMERILGCFFLSCMEFDLNILLGFALMRCERPAPWSFLYLLLKTF